MPTPAGPRHAFDPALADPAGPVPVAGPGPEVGTVPAPRAAPGGGKGPADPSAGDPTVRYDGAQYATDPTDFSGTDTDVLPVLPAAQAPASLFVPQGPGPALPIDDGLPARPVPSAGMGPTGYAPAYDPGSSRPAAFPDVTGPALPPAPGRPVATTRPVRVLPVFLALVVGALVAVGLGVYGRVHEPTGVAINVAGFSSGLAAKSWLASLALVFVLVQLVSARRMYRGGGRVAAGLHRWSGRIAVLVTVPVAIHCLYALGYQDFSVRVLVHSLAGCFFYGAFVAKMMVLGSRSRTPGWVIPVLGGAVLTGFTALWLTSSLWFFTTSGPSF